MKSTISVLLQKSRTQTALFDLFYVFLFTYLLFIYLIFIYLLIYLFIFDKLPCRFWHQLPVIRAHVCTRWFVDANVRNICLRAGM